MAEDMPVCRLYTPGMMPYEEAWRLQERLAEQVARGESPALLLLEHPHTFTLGRRGRSEHLLWGETELQARGAKVYEVDRGGDITYHGPGQLVGYPILRLAEPGWQGGRLPQADFVGHIRRLEEMIILALGILGLRTTTRPSLSGVWVPARNGSTLAGESPRGSGPSQPGKIASIGVKVDVHGVSRHGFALNVCTDADYWSGIIPCGLEGVRMVSLADYFDPPPAMESVRAVIADCFAQVFNMKLEPWNGFPAAN